MDKNVVYTEKAPNAIGPYSQAIKSNGFLFISGQIAIDPATGKFDPESDIKSQTEQVMNNLKAVLESEGLTFDNVVKTTIYLADMNDFPTVNEIYGSYFSNKDFPSRATVAVALPKNAKVEIEMIAVLK